MWHPLIRGSVFSSIRGSPPSPSDKLSGNDLPSSQNEPTQPTVNDNCNPVDPIDARTNRSPPSKRCPQLNKFDAKCDDYNLNNWINKGTTSSLDHTTDDSLPSPKDNGTGLDTTTSISSSRSLRASRSLLSIAASRPPYHLEKSTVLIGSEEQIKDDDSDYDMHQKDTNDDNNNSDIDDVGKGGYVNGSDGESKDTTIGAADDKQWNDKKHQRQATIITIPSRAFKQPLNANTTTTATITTKKKPKQPKTSATEPNKSVDKPKKKRRWENVSPPSSPTKMNYEVSMATIASPPNKRKPTGADVPRPHACPICDRRFNRRYNLTAHIRVHDPNRKKLFDCPSCNQSFDRKHDRDRHADALHFEHKHRCYCHLCDASFTRRDALTRHVHKLHTQAQSTTTTTTTTTTTAPTPTPTHSTSANSWC